MIEARRIAVCGGTFDPIHCGHVDPLLEVFERMEWDHVLYVPAATQPFKRDRRTGSSRDRWAMMSIATACDPRLRLTPIELERGEVSYSVDTLEELRRLHPDAGLEWVIGDDNLEQLVEWRSIERIFELANFVVLRRTGAVVPEALAGRVASPETRGVAGSVVPVDNTPVAISATGIRRRVAAGEPIGELVAPGVADYIEKYRLYRPEDRT
ncbi:MAG TPA: nicotinate-nucleotide adenylyltransferase [Thermoanaerobaculia bacterium]|nr:nicotinate-nucleotide adenylyltransferase [Thermoanaerobaculia bacterium]